jgi:hypothetical protein
MYSVFSSTNVQQILKTPALKVDHESARLNKTSKATRTPW